MRLLTAHATPSSPTISSSSHAHWLRGDEDGDVDDDGDDGDDDDGDDDDEAEQLFPVTFTLNSILFSI